MADHVFQVLRRLQEGLMFVLFTSVDNLLGYFVTLVFFPRLSLVVSGESEIIQFNQDKLGAFGITECRLGL